MSLNFDQYRELMFSRTKSTHGLQQNLSDGDTCYNDSAKVGLQLLGEEQ